MEENKEGLKYIILNSNILFSALIKEEGFTRAVLLFLKEDQKIRLIIPKIVLSELKLYTGEIARKSGLSLKDVLIAFEKLLENIKQINELDLTKEMKLALRYVKDERDAPFIAVAFKHKPSFILTYNKKDYKMN